jgi:cyclopropane fatty-acyl-phospholipid synthase-like methyltransferase
VLHSITQALINSGFSDIEFRDDSPLFLRYTQKWLENLSKNKDFIALRYSHELFSTVWKEHEALIEKISQHQTVATRIVAKKANCASSVCV